MSSLRLASPISRLHFDIKFDPFHITNAARIGIVGSSSLNRNFCFKKLHCDPIVDQFNPRFALRCLGNGVAAFDGAGPFAKEQCSTSCSEERRRNQQNQHLEECVETAIFNCRFLTLLAVLGSLAGSLLCFFKGSLYIMKSFVEYFHGVSHGLHTGEVIFLLVEAVDVYLMGTVMLIFGMGLYELFVSTLEIPGEDLPAGVPKTTVCGSNLFGLFRLQERPKWLEIRSLDELKTKLGHVIVMILLVGMFENSKKVPINTSFDLLCLSVSIFFSSGCLYLLSKLHQK